MEIIEDSGKQCCIEDYLEQLIADITKLRNEERKAQLRERLAVVGEQAAGIAHDFNNILGAIILYAQRMLKFSELPEDDQRRLETVDQ